MPAAQPHRAAPRFQRLLSHRLDRPLGGVRAAFVLSWYLPLRRGYPPCPKYLFLLLPSLSLAPHLFCAHLLAHSNLEPIFSLQTLPPFASSTISSLSSPDANSRSFIIRHASPGLKPLLRITASQAFEPPATSYKNPSQPRRSLSPAKTPQTDRRLFAAAGPTLSSHPNPFFPTRHPGTSEFMSIENLKSFGMSLSF